MRRLALVSLLALTVATTALAQGATAIDVRTILGQPLTAIDARFTPVDPPPAGWTRWYTAAFGVLADGGTVTAVIVPIPSGATCDEVAALAGFPDAMPPLRRVGGCEWPGISERHALGPGVSGFTRDGHLVVAMEHP